MSPFIYIHNPKTGGSSICDHFSRNFHGYHQHIWNIKALKFGSLKYLRMKKRSLIMGHVPFGIHKLFLTYEEYQNAITSLMELSMVPMISSEIWVNKMNYTYGTILRHPLSRMYSHHWYHMHSVTDDKAFQQYVKFMESSKDFSVAHISGVYYKLWFNESENGVQSNFYKLPKNFEVTEKHYEIARLNTINMGWVGVYDQLEESLKQLQHFWGMRDDGFNFTNDERNEERVLSDKEVKNILKDNYFDLQLYNIGKVLFEQQQIVLKYSKSVYMN